MNRLSNEEAVLLDKLHDTLEERRQGRFKEQGFTLSIFDGKEEHAKKARNYHLEIFSFSVSTTPRKMNIDMDKFENQLSNLITLGLLKWETDVDVSARKSSDDPLDDDIDVDVNVSNNDEFIFTKLGDKFVKACSGKNKFAS